MKLTVVMDGDDLLKTQVMMFLFLILGGCGTVSQKAPDPFGVDLHHKMDFLEPKEIEVVYPARMQRDSLTPVYNDVVFPNN